MGPEHIPNQLFNEIGAALQAMAQARSLEEKLTYSRILKNLSDCLGVFFGMLETQEEFEED